MLLSQYYYIFLYFLKYIFQNYCTKNVDVSCLTTISITFVNIRFIWVYISINDLRYHTSCGSGVGTFERGVVESTVGVVLGEGTKPGVLDTP